MIQYCRQFTLGAVWHHCWGKLNWSDGSTTGCVRPANNNVRDIESILSVIRRQSRKTKTRQTHTWMRIENNCRLSATFIILCLSAICEFSVYCLLCRRAVFIIFLYFFLTLSSSCFHLHLEPSLELFYLSRSILAVVVVVMVTVAVLVCWTISRGAWWWPSRDRNKIKRR